MKFGGSVLRIEEVRTERPLAATLLALREWLRRGDIDRAGLLNLEAASEDARVDDSPERTRPTAGVERTIRVDAARLDHQLDLVGELWMKSGKKVAFEVSGEEPELGRTVVEKVADPLVRLARNAIDHGPRGLPREDETPSDAELFAMICEPGFSTAAQVTEPSGRGVGMDAVRRNINAMGGALEIQSESDLGTRLSMNLPLTLAVIDGMLVSGGAERYVIPTLSMAKLAEPRASDIATGLAETPGASGCTTLSDGRVDQALDIGGLLRLARSKTTAAPRAATGRAQRVRSENAAGAT